MTLRCPDYSVNLKKLKGKTADELLDDYALKEREVGFKIAIRDLILERPHYINPSTTSAMIAVESLLRDIDPKIGTWEIRNLYTTVSNDMTQPVREHMPHGNRKKQAPQDINEPGDRPRPDRDF